MIYYIIFKMRYTHNIIAILNGIKKLNEHQIVDKIKQNIKSTDRIINISEEMNAKLQPHYSDLLKQCNLKNN